MSPEMLLKFGHSFSLDYYCLGCLLFEIVIGHPPFYSKNIDEIYVRVLVEEVSFPQYPHLSKQIKDLIGKLLVKNPNERMGYHNGIEEILDHPWFKGVDVQSIL